MFEMTCSVCQVTHSQWQVWMNMDHYHKITRQEEDVVYIKGEPEDTDVTDASLICTKCWSLMPEKGWEVEVDLGK
jgi:hypothetical protein